MLLVNAEEAKGAGEQRLDRALHIGAHVTGEDPRRRNELIFRDASEMPVQRLVREAK